MQHVLSFDTAGHGERDDSGTEGAGVVGVDKRPEERPEDGRGDSRDAVDAVRVRRALDPLDDQHPDRRGQENRLRMTPPVVVERRRPREHDRDPEGEHARLEERSPWVERQGEVRPPDEGKRAIDQRRVPRLEHPTDRRSDRNEEQERRR